MINRIRPHAEALYETAARNYMLARNTEQRARDACVIGIRKAFSRLPGFKANSDLAETIIENTPGLAAEMNEAASVDDDVRLPGQGIVPPFGVDSTDFSETHQDLMNRAATVKYIAEGPRPVRHDRGEGPVRRETVHHLCLRPAGRHRDEATGALRSKPK